MTQNLYTHFSDSFRLGAALSGFIYDTVQQNFMESHFSIKNPADIQLAASHFNLIVAENDTKMERVYRGEGDFNFDTADKFIQFGKKNSQSIRWHTLVWHAQSPDWIFTADGRAKEEERQFKMPSVQELSKNCTVSKEVLECRLRDYIFAVGERYSDSICSVDVVNECISDKNFALRTIQDYSRWHYVLGDDYVEKAFFWAKDAFPKASLVINDYNLESIREKRQGMKELLEFLLRKGVPVDTVGLQMHIDIENPSVQEIEDTIELYGKMGLGVIVTEMEISMYTSREEQKKEYTAELFEKQAERYQRIFECFKKEAAKGFLRDVVLWGVTDRFSWKNDFPVPSRTDAPLLFDKDGNPKPAFYALERV